MWRSRIVIPNAPSSLLLVAISFAPCLVAPTPVQADELFASSGDDVGSPADKAKAAVVRVRSGDKGFILAGSGFFIDDQGTLLTSSSILGDNKTARVVIADVEMDAQIIGNDSRSGLAMLKVSSDATPFLALGHSTDIKTGNTVTAIGYPLNLQAAPAQGQVSGFDVSYLTQVSNNPSEKRSVSAVERFATTHIHANVAISPGEVGGPLLNSRGEVIGMVATSPDNGRSIYALPVEAIQKIMTDFTQCGHARHGWVGINFVEAPDTNHDGRTVRVVHVVDGTPASHSGIRPGDTVMRIDSREIYRPADVLDASFFSHVGGNMTVVVRRDETLYNYTFAVIERPAEPGSNTKPVTDNPVHRDMSPVRPILVNDRQMANSR